MFWPMRSLQRVLLVAVLALMAATTPANAASSSQTVVVSVSFAAQTRSVHQVGPGGSVSYGQLRFTGTTTLDGQAVAAELLSSVHYTRGTGPFTGWVTLTKPDGSLLGLELLGHTKAQPDTTDATFSGQVLVTGGTGTYATARGSGTLSGSRKAALGGTADLTFRIRLRT